MDENGVFNLTEASPSAKFYDEMYSSEHDRAPLPEDYHKVKEGHQKDGSAYRIMDGILTFLESKLDRSAIVIEIGGSVHQNRSANAVERFPNYFPLDISYSSMRKYSTTYGRPGIAADATNLPFADASVDCIFTHTFLEHPLKPENVLEEIHRVLKPGGIVVHNDAWFCRWWHRFGVIGLKPVSSMNSKEKLINFAQRITEFPLLRIPPIIVGRLLRTLFRGMSQPIRLRYRALKPNYDLHLGCDEDAASAIDPIDVIDFYISRRYELFEPLSLKQRLFYPNKYVALHKR